MNIAQCPKGHFYDPSQTNTCPKCAQAENLNFAGDFDYTMPPTPTPLSVTMPANESAGDIPTTVPIDPADVGKNFTIPVNHGKEPMVDDYSATVPVDYSSANPFAKANSMANQASNVQPYDSTMPVDFLYRTGEKASYDPMATIPANNYVAKPVVGWIVCVDGPNKGCDYRIYNGYNHIGRYQNMDICISGDMYISGENAAVIGYDDIEKVFYFGPGMGHNTVRVNEKMCIGQTLLNAYDRIKLGKSTLVFIPLCGEGFDWKDEK